MSDSSKLLSLREAAFQLGVPLNKVREWCTEGAPYIGGGKRGISRKFDPDVLSEWLVSTGRAELSDEEEVEPEPPRQVILTKRREVAERFGTSARVVATWLEDPTFPGRAGASGQGHGPSMIGYFPELEIAKWIAANPKMRTPIPDDLKAQIEQTPLGKEASNHGNNRDRLVRARADRAELELAQLRGELLDAEEAIRFYSRQNAQAATILKSLPSQAVSTLPSDVSDATRQTIFEVLTTVINQVRESLAELIEGDQDEQPQSQTRRTG